MTTRATLYEVHAATADREPQSTVVFAVGQRQYGWTQMWQFSLCAVKLASTAAGSCSQCATYATVDAVEAERYAHEEVRRKRV